MPNMSLKKNPMPSQEPDVRNKNFDEVALGYTAEQAMDEAARCLNCKNMPCVGGCPVKIHIPIFIAETAKGNFERAYEIISEASSLPAVCGRVCPQENQCEGKCVRGIKGEPVAIGRLERFVADYHNAHCTEKKVKPESNGHKVAVIGSGPAGLSCAGELAKRGYEVTVFEALHVAGGVLVYGIPEFRLPKAIVRKEIDGLKEMGVKIETNMVIGKTLSIDELKEEYGFEAVFIGSGAGLPKFMNIPGENLKGVYSANEFLTRINLMKAYRDDSQTPIQHAKNVAVVGGGNAAVEEGIYLTKFASKVYIVHRRDSLRADKIVQERAFKNEKIEFVWDSVVEEIKGDSKVESVVLKNVKTNKTTEMKTDGVFPYIGFTPNCDNFNGQLKQDEKGFIVTDEYMQTSIQGVFAIGDVRVTPLRQVITAVADGAVAGVSAVKYLEKVKEEVRV